MTKTFAYYLNNYFNIYLPKEISASENTIISYKNTFKLLINFSFVICYILNNLLNLAADCPFVILRFSPYIIFLFVSTFVTWRQV